MKRSLIGLLLVLLAVGSFTVGDAQRRRGGRRGSTPAGGGKVAIKCPTTLDSITDCPDTGCGPSLDPLLNKAKNIPSLSGQAETMTIKDMKALPDPVEDYAIGDPRDKITALGDRKSTRLNS